MTASGITAVAVVSGLLIADIVFGVVVTYSKNLCKNVVDEGYDNTAYGDGWNDGYNEGAEDAGIDTEDAVNAAYETGTQFGLEAGFAEGLAAGLALNLLANDTLLENLNEAYSKVEEAYTEGYELGYEECIADYDNGFYNFDDLEVGDVIVFDIESYDPNEVLDDEDNILEGDVDDSEDEDEIDADLDACGDLGCPICNSDDDEFDDYDNDLSAENDQVEESSEADAVAQEFQMLVDFNEVLQVVRDEPELPGPMPDNVRVLVEKLIADGRLEDVIRQGVSGTKVAIVKHLIAKFGDPTSI